jgi:hypothetical protein
LTAQVEAWLRAKWLPEGPPVCVLEGGSGVGKTTIVNRLLNAVQIERIRIVASGGALGIDDILFELALALDRVAIDSMTNRADGDLIGGLGDSLDREVLIVIDDFDELVNP